MPISVAWKLGQTPVEERDRVVRRLEQMACDAAAKAKSVKARADALAPLEAALLEAQVEVLALAAKDVAAGWHWILPTTAPIAMAEGARS